MKRLISLAAMFIIALAFIQNVWAQTKVYQTSTGVVNIKDITPSLIGYGVVGCFAIRDSMIYAGSTNYLWISTNSGNTWVQRGLKDGLEASGGWVKSVAIIDSDCALVGGDGRYSANQDGGIFKSKDRGATWHRVSDFDAKTLLVARDGTILAGGFGILRSTDNGDSWIQIASDSTTDPYIWRMTQTVSGTILAGISSSMPTDGRGVLRSTDNGISWALENNGLSAHKCVMGLSASISSTSAFIATYDDGAYRSTNDGISWTHITEIPEIYGRSAAASSKCGVFIGFMSFGMNTLYRSTDDGSSWESISGFGGYTVNALAEFGSNSLVVGINNGVYLATFNDSSTGVNDEPKGLPESFILHQNYPNPFNPSTTIEFSISKRMNVNLTIYNTLGQKIETLVDREMGSGDHGVTWNASKYPSGTYFMSLTTDNGFKTTKKMMLVK
jgi:hypothetical protein